MIVLLAAASQAAGQASNMDTFEALAVACTEDLGDSAGDLVLDAPSRMPYVRSAIVAALQSQGRQVYLADSTFSERPDALSTFLYSIEEARVVYERIRKKRARRTVHFSAATALTSARGRLISDEICQQQFADTVAIADLASLQNSAYPETQAPIPEAGFARRFLQPLTLGAATALTVYLFFTLRSESSSDGN